MEYADILHRCFRCGYCKFTRDYRDFNCPTYTKFWFESYSPGGRMWLLRAWLNGEIKPTERLAEIFYSCVMCGNCVEHCALEFREHLVNIFVAARNEFVEQGLAPPAVRDYLKGIQTHGNPFKEPRQSRGKWADGLGIQTYSGQDYLLYAGCVASYDDRGKKIARAVATVLKKAGVSFGILAGDEASDGNEVRLLGECDLFRMLAQENIRIFKERGVTKIITVSPHAYNAFKNDYPPLGGAFDVMHYTQALDQLIQKGEFSPPEEDVRVTYQDSCYLGRHNGVFDEPRNILRAIPGARLIEMDKIKKNALCCGGGGGNFFTDIIGSGGSSPSRVRIREAVATGANVLAVACPKCAGMFENAVKAEALEGSIKVKDVAEIVQEGN